MIVILEAAQRLKDLSGMYEGHYYVYILASKTYRLYIGVTNDLERRVHEHKQKIVEGFTSRYNIYRLVYYETFGDIHVAIAREKELKGWLKYRKYELIESQNPQWRDLSEDWGAVD